LADGWRRRQFDGRNGTGAGLDACGKVTVAALQVGEARGWGRERRQREGEKEKEKEK